MAAEKFDLAKIQQYFEESLFDEDDILVESYLLAYKELYKYVIIFFLS